MLLKPFSKQQNFSFTVQCHYVGLFIESSERDGERDFKFDRILITCNSELFIPFQKAEFRTLQAELNVFVDKIMYLTTTLIPKKHFIRNTVYQ